MFVTLPAAMWMCSRLCASVTTPPGSVCPCRACWHAHSLRGAAETACLGFGDCQRKCEHKGRRDPAGMLGSPLLERLVRVFELEMHRKLYHPLAGNVNKRMRLSLFVQLGRSHYALECAHGSVDGTELFVAALPLAFGPNVEHDGHARSKGVQMLCPKVLDDRLVVKGLEPLVAKLVAFGAGHGEVGVPFFARLVWVHDRTITHLRKQVPV